MKNSTFSTALKATIPVMAGYIILGTGFGLSMKNYGYSILMIFLMSAFIYAGSLLGGVIGELLPFNLAGIDFSMTALFYATLIAQWKNNRDHTNAITGLLASLVSILIFGKDNF